MAGHPLNLPVELCFWTYFPFLLLDKQGVNSLRFSFETLNRETLTLNWTNQQFFELNELIHELNQLIVSWVFDPSNWRDYWALIDLMNCKVNSEPHFVFWIKLSVQTTSELLSVIWFENIVYCFLQFCWVTKTETVEYFPDVFIILLYKVYKNRFPTDLNCWAAESKYLETSKRGVTANIVIHCTLIDSVWYLHTSTKLQKRIFS